MKKIVFTALVFVFAFSLYISYEETKNEEAKKLETLEEKMATSFVIPEGFPLADPDEAYPLMLGAANEFQINIFRSGYNFRPDGQVEILKYVLLTGETDFFDHVRLADGRVLQAEDTQQGRRFLSSAKTKDENQVGLIRYFGNEELIRIQPLQTAYQFLPFEGKYFAESANEKDIQFFLESFSQRINTYFEESGQKLDNPYAPEDFQKSAGGGEYGFDAISSTRTSNFLPYISYVLFVMMTVLLIYYLFSVAKRLGVMKMHGVANLRLWWIVVGKLICAAAVITALGALLSAVVLHAPPSYLTHSLTQLVQATLILISLSLLAYGYIAKIQISQSIKNRRDTQGIFGINMLLKVICSIALILMGLVMFDQYAQIKAQQDEMKYWAHIKDYGVFYPYSIGNDLEDLKNDGGRNQSSINDQLYPILNTQGAVYIDAEDYEEEVLLVNHDYDGIISVQVNPNYLKEFPVYDKRNQPVRLSENTRDWILLVPEQYSNQKKRILHFFEKGRKKKIKNQEIQIIWLAENQHIFSLNPEVFKDEGNMILDPIIQVMTEGNSVTADRSSIRGGGATDPLKVKLIDRDTALTYQTLLPDLKRLKLDDNFKNLITVDQYVLQELHHLQKWMNIYAFIMLGLIVALSFLVTQSLLIFFHKYQQRFVVHRLLGIGFFRTYRIYFVWLAITWVGLIMLSLGINKTLDIRLVKGVVDLHFWAVVAGLSGIELLASMIALLSIEGRNQIQVIKGGD